MIPAGQMDKAYRAPLIIAELGTAHQGDLGRAAEMVHAAAQAGARVVKFQYVIASEILHPNAGTVPLPGGPRELYKVFLELERPPDFYGKLAQICEDAGVEFLCTPFGLESATRLLELGVRRLKVASPELNHHPLLEFLARSGLPLILSSGVSKLADIEESLDLVHRIHDGLDRRPEPTNLLHCITSYPAPEEEYNLSLVDNLSRIFGIPLGVSDHSLDPVLVPALSGCLGAVIVEKHFTLSKTGGGLDDPIALDPKELGLLCAELGGFEGRPGKEVLRELERVYGEDRIRKVLGNGVKGLAASEAANYGRTNRSIHAMDDLEAGEVLTRDNIAILRTEKVLSPGLHPRYYRSVLGRKLREPLAAGQGLSWDNLLGRGE